MRARGIVVGHPRVLRAQVVAGTRRTVPEHVGVELPPGQLAAERVGPLGAGTAPGPRPAAPGQVREQSPRMHLAVLQMGRHRRRSGRGRQVPALAVPVDAVVALGAERLPSGEGGPLARLGQRDALRVGLVRQRLAVDVREDVDGEPDAVGTVRGGRPAVPLPGLEERREDLVRVARPVADRARADGVRRPGPHQPDVDPAERRVDRFVAGAPVRSGVRGHVHARRTHLGRHGGHHVRRMARTDDEPSAAVGEIGVEGAQRAQEPDAPRGTGRIPETRVDDEQRDDVPRGRGGQQGRVVVQPEVSAQPQEGSGHDQAT